eukprot:5085508-Amphidinium_carterae.1
MNAFNRARSERLLPTGLRRNLHRQGEFGLPAYRLHLCPAGFLFDSHGIYATETAEFELQQSLARCDHSRFVPQRCGRLNDDEIALCEHPPGARPYWWPDLLQSCQRLPLAPVLTDRRLPFGSRRKHWRPALLVRMLPDVSSHAFRQRLVPEMMHHELACMHAVEQWTHSGYSTRPVLSSCLE